MSTISALPNGRFSINLRKAPGSLVKRDTRHTSYREKRRGIEVSDSKNNIPKSESGVHVKPGSGGKSVISIGDERFGLSFETNLANTNVVVNTDGETQVISEGKDGSVNIEKKVVCVENEGEETQQVSQGNEVSTDVKKGSVVTEQQGGTHTDSVTTTETIGDAQVTKTKTTEVTDKRGVRTEKKTTLTETKSPGGQYTRKTLESKTTVGKGASSRTSGKSVDPKVSGGASRETAAQRRAKENKTVSAKSNIFKTQDVKVSQSKVNQPTTFKIKPGCPGTATTVKAVDAATGNIEKLLKWIQKRVNQYPAVDVTNFTTSWEDGIALCALMNYLLGDEVLDPKDVSATDRLCNFQIAIKAATDNGVPELLKAEELACGDIDRRSMVTYLHMIYTKLFAEKKEEEKRKEEEKKKEGGC